MAAELAACSGKRDDSLPHRCASVTTHQPRIIIVFSRLTLNSTSSLGSFGRHLIHNSLAGPPAGRQRLIVAGHQCVGAVPLGQPRAKQWRVGRWPLCSAPIVFRVSQSVINQRSTHKGGRATMGRCRLDGPSSTLLLLSTPTERSA